MIKVAIVIRPKSKIITYFFSKVSILLLITGMTSKLTFYSKLIEKSLRFRKDIKKQTINQLWHQKVSAGIILLFMTNKFGKYIWLKPQKPIKI